MIAVVKQIAVAVLVTGVSAAIIWRVPALKKLVFPA